MNQNDNIFICTKCGSTVRLTSYEDQTVISCDCSNVSFATRLPSIWSLRSSDEVRALNSFRLAVDVSGFADLNSAMQSARKTMEEMGQSYPPMIAPFMTFSEKVEELNKKDAEIRKWIEDFENLRPPSGLEMIWRDVVDFWDSMLYWISQFHVSIKFKWQDIWIGAYVDDDSRILYICILPMLPIKIDLPVDVYQ